MAEEHPQAADDSRRQVDSSPNEPENLLDLLDRYLDDQDAFLVKLPHKFKEALSQPEIYNLTKETSTIGSIEQSRRSVPMQWRNPEIQFEDLLGAEDLSDSRIELLMPLNLPARSDKRLTERILFELDLPSLKEISKTKRRKLNEFEAKHEMHFVCTLKDEAQDHDDDDHDERRVAHRQPWKGQILHRVVGEAILRPSSVADLDAQTRKGLTEEEIKKMLTTSDEQRTSIVTEIIEEPIQAPGLIRLEELKDEPTQRRVSLTTAELTQSVMRCFREKTTWRVEELADYLNHPKEPINKLLKQIGELDPIRKWYKLKDTF